MAPDEDDAYRKWKRCATPMYDWMTNNHLVWPALACRFGPREENSDSSSYKQTIYISEQVAKEEKTPNKLVVHSVSVLKEFHAPLDHISSWKENQKSPLFTSQPEKVIHHPGECNKIREIHGHDHIVVTHSDCAEVYVWDLEKQPDASTMTKPKKGGNTNAPDLLLVGHQAQAPFALSTSTHSPSVASGGEDHGVLLWNLEDENQITVLTNRSSTERRGGELNARVTLAGHTATVTDVCFAPATDHLLASAADDHTIRLWDTRQGKSTHQIANAHDGFDILCMDWSAGGLLASGDASGRVRIRDLRKLSSTAALDSPLFEFPQLQGLEKEVLAISWNRHRPGFLLSGGDDSRITVYDTNRPSSAEHDNLPSQLVMQHIGHLGNIMDLQWSPSPDDPLMCMGVSNDGESFKGGGTIQMWRPSWLLYEDVDVVERQLRTYQDWLETGGVDDLENVVADIRANTAAQLEGAREAARVLTEAAPEAAQAAQSSAAPDDADAFPAAAERMDAEAAVSPAAEEASAGTVLDAGAALEGGTADRVGDGKMEEVGEEPAAGEEVAGGSAGDQEAGAEAAAGDADGMDES